MNIKKEYAFVKNMQAVEQLKEQARDLQKLAGPAASMTSFEKEQAHKKIQFQKEALRGSVVSSLAYDWEMVKSEYKTLQVEKAAAAARAARGWDFPRLQYDRQRAADLLKKSANDPVVIAQTLEKIKIDGDRSLLRAFGEEALATLDPRSLTGEKLFRTLEVRSQLEKTVEKLTVTQEQKDLAQQGGILTEKVTTLAEATNKLMSEYPNQEGTPFDKLRAGVKITKRVDENLTTITSVDVDWD